MARVRLRQAIDATAQAPASLTAVSRFAPSKSFLTGTRLQGSGAPRGSIPTTTRRASLPTRRKSFCRCFVQALKRGVQIETHAIGDRPTGDPRFVRKAFNLSTRSAQIREPRWRVSMPNRQTGRIGRFAKLGVIPSMQPSHAVGAFVLCAKQAGISGWKGLMRGRAL